MANLKEIRNRIVSIQSTMQITSAMKMVSAAKLKKAQDAITAMRPYSEKLTEILQAVSATMEGDTGAAYTAQREVNNVLIVVITSNRGLCGAFNANVIKEARLLLAKYKGKNVQVVTIGKKGTDLLKKEANLLSSHNELFDNLTFANAAQIADVITSKFVNGDVDKVEFVYNQFKNAATQEVKVEQYLPLVQNDLDNVNSDYLFEPEKVEILLTLIPKALKTQFYKAIRDSFAAEHGARMTAMHKATDNATDLRNQLKLTYNKARQAAITGEILEIVGGAEALNN
jgi:F-type H+-transporting ATPase subunit gamma